MLLKRNLMIWLMVSWIVHSTTGLFFNQPKFCPLVSWQTNGTTFANVTMLGYSPLGLFIDNNNTIYATDRTNNRTLIWSEGSQTPTTIISHNSAQPIGIFVTNNGDIYIDNGAVNKRVDKWSTNSTTSVPVMYVNDNCYGLFVDSNNTLYCSIQSQHQVIKISLNDTPNMTVIAVGTGSCGSASNMLCYPCGIYVDTNFDLYVADLGNDRIQLFKSGQTNGATVIGNGSLGTILSYQSTNVMMDGNGYLFIVDRLNHSIIRSGPNGYHCVVGCSGTSGSNVDQLNNPYNLAFDSYGDMFVMDEYNNRLQKFIMTRNSCISYNQPKLCSNATWNVNASTFANSTMVGTLSQGFFVGFNDTIYFPNQIKNGISVWANGSINPVRNLTIEIAQYTSLFTTIDGDIYFENGNETGRIDKWKSNANSSEFVTKFNGNCYGLFVDINNILYCSIQQQHLVMSISLNNNTNSFTTVAGDRSSGPASNQLNQPFGIFVDINFDLYVADAGNNRIQLFRSGQLNGTTVAGSGIPHNLTLIYPTDVILDADGYMFIADNAHHRIIRVGPTDYYCVAACTGVNGSAANQLQKPYSLRFDSQGNIYVADEFNSRIQKFMLTTNSCVETSTAATSTYNPTITSSSAMQDQTTRHDEHNTTNEMASTTDTKDSTITTVETTTNQPNLLSFVPPTCSDPSRIGIHCAISNSPCAMIQPCQHNSICNSINTTLLGYNCSCLPGFNGTQCQFDYRPCKPNTCWNNGTCKELPNTTFLCQCDEGWQGIHCQTKINYCKNVKCENNGVCRPLFRAYKCECLGESFSGEHCEIIATKIQMYRIASKSFAYVAIIALISVAMFIVIMDILKYCFGIDPVEGEREQLRRKKQVMKRKPVIQRFVYVNPPSEAPVSCIEQTTS